MFLNARRVCIEPVVYKRQKTRNNPGTTESGIMENKLFWKTLKPFVTNKSGISNDNIMIVDNERLMTKS